MFRIVCLFSLLTLCMGVDDDDDVCQKSCGSASDDELCSIKDCNHRVGRCCWKADGITIDLRNCNLLDLQANTFLRGSTLKNQTHDVQRLCLDHNAFGPKNVSQDAFRGLINLTFLSLPSTFAECPGGNAYWVKATPEQSLLLCQTQHGPCNISKEACPEHSHCVDDGPGLMRCRCDDGFYGYKCLKSGNFPYAIFYGSLCGATVLTSAVLWFIGRRKIGLHTKQS